MSGGLNPPVAAHHRGRHRHRLQPDHQVPGPDPARPGGRQRCPTWNADGTPRATLTGHNSWVSAVAISPDGTWLATASGHRAARSWKTDGSSTSATAIRADGTFSDCAWFPQDS